ncbi:BTB/POZ domain-containing protein At2g30600-like isoform X2 [Vicia villosa]|uniref:BTB/POZ domain-containing protein At2g30600-like isoform X2 n=1 Tax=Vicia villosa TaxID=3911 RepID=UPI00273C5D15|nr:BTB/POZ domain-containing protein At2g30600-like isoform X2 [Vicia villosa]
MLAYRLYFYYSYSYELTGDLAEIRGNLFQLHWITTLRHDELGQVQYICDGDDHGVTRSSNIFVMGMTMEFVGILLPVLAFELFIHLKNRNLWQPKKITITSSSPHSRYTDPKVLVSRTYQGTCFAGPRLENGHNCSWWMVDLGQDHQLMCSYYTMRQDGSKHFRDIGIFRYEKNQFYRAHHDYFADTVICRSTDHES